MWPTRYNSPLKTRWCLGRFLRLVVDVWLSCHCHASDWTILSLSFSLMIKWRMLLLTKLHSICGTLIKKIFYEKVFMVEWVCQLAKDTGKMTLFKGTGKVKHRHDRGEVFSCPNKTHTIGKDHLKRTSYSQKFIKQNDSNLQIGDEQTLIKRKFCFLRRHWCSLQWTKSEYLPADADKWRNLLGKCSYHLRNGCLALTRDIEELLNISTTTHIQQNVKEPWPKSDICPTSIEDGS